LRNPTHHYAEAGVYTVSLLASNSFGSDVENKVSYIVIGKPNAPALVNDTVCDSGVLSLAATGTSGVVQWFASAASNTALDTGTSFTTPTLSTTTTYYVDEKTTGATQHVGPVDNGFGGGGILTVTAQYNTFNVLTPLTLVSVLVYASGAMSRTIQLKDNTGAILRDTTLYVNDGPSRLNLNWLLPVQNNLRMAVAATADMGRRNSGASYPYTIPGVISITGSSAGAGFYYFFYDWEVKQEDCMSERGECIAYVLPTPTPSVSGSNAACENETQTYSVAAVSGATYQWNITNGTVVSGCGSGDNTCTVQWNTGTGTINCDVSVP
jgi:PKD repeat protein